MLADTTVGGVSATGLCAGQGRNAGTSRSCLCFRIGLRAGKCDMLARKSNSCWRFHHKTACWEAKCLQKQQLLVHRPHDSVLDKGELLAEAAVAGVCATGLRARHGRLGWCLGHMTACCTKANAGRINSCWCLGHRTASRTRAKCWQKQ